MNDALPIQVGPEVDVTRRAQRRGGVILLLVALSLVVAACSSSDGTAGTSTSEATTTLAATTAPPTTRASTTSAPTTTTAAPTTTATTAAPTLDEPDICAVPGECPDFSTALPGDDGVGPLPLGAVDSVPNEDRLDFLVKVCFRGECFLDAAFVDSPNPELWEFPGTAGHPFHVRHGFINSTGDPLGEGFNLVVYVSRQEAAGDDPPEVTEAEEADFELGEVYKFTADYVLQGSSDRCGPTFESQTSSETCEWFVHDFSDGLPAGRFTIWAIWEAPCSAWLDLGLTERCEDPDRVMSKFSSSVNSPFGGSPRD